MRTASEIMHQPAPAVDPSLTIKELYAWLTERGLDGACVVEDDKLTGVVTQMDLVFKEKKVHMPTFFFFLDAVVPVMNPQKTMDEVQKIAGARVGDIATSDVITVAPGTSVDEVATLMVDKHLTVLPVVDDGKLVGMVTKQDVLKAAFG